MLQDFFNYITVITFIQGFIYSIIFVFNKNRNLSLQLLAGFLITGVGPNLIYIVVSLFGQKVYLPTSFAFLTPPLFFLYVKSVLGVLSKRDYKHLIPGIVEFVFLLALFLFPEELAEPFYNSEKNPMYKFYFVVLIPIYGIVYYLLTINQVRIYKSIIPKLYSIDELKRLKWITITCIILISFYVMDAVNSYLLIETNLDAFVLLFITSGTCFIVYWVCVYGLTQKSLLLSLIISDEALNAKIDESSVDNDELNTVQKKSLPFDEKAESDFKTLISFFENTKIHKNKDLNLFIVADFVQMSYRDVSRLINNYGNKNFNQFINEFRIEEAKKLIEEDNLNKFNLSGIAEEVGFNSRSTFFAAFKSITGMTPIEYKNSIKSELEQV